VRKLFNTLYITSQGTYLSKERETIAVHLEDDTKRRFPFHNLDGIVCLGNIRLSPYLIGACGERGITISYLTEHGKYLGRFTGSVSGNVLLRRQQYRFADDDQRRVAIARNIVLGKLGNSNTVLKRFLRDNPNREKKGEIESVIYQIKHTMGRVQSCNSLEAIRGSEGEAASQYFSVFNQLIIQQKDDFIFKGRNRRPPLDPVNSLLSFIYTLIHHDLTSACETVGLDPAVGYLHVDRPGRNSLALDLMEEFRAFLADRIVLSLINRKQVNAKDFTFHSSGAVTLSEKAKKALLETYQKRKQETIIHPFLQEKMQIGVLFYYQALLLSRYIRGDIEEYPPFLWR
jgi:CRISP-associated protein Cas1